MKTAEQLADDLFRYISHTQYSRSDVEHARHLLRAAFLRKTGWKLSKAMLHKTNARGQYVKLWGDDRPNPPLDHPDVFRDGKELVLVTHMYPPIDYRAYDEFAEKYLIDYTEIKDFPSWHYPRHCKVFVWRDISTRTNKLST